MRAFPMLAILGLVTPAVAEPPVASYLFPAGGQRGTEVEVRVGGLFFHGGAEFAVTGEGVAASPRVEAMETIWFEGPLIFQPDSQRAEDYPRDHLGLVKIDPKAPHGARHATFRTVQGITGAIPFLVGEYPEIVEREIDGYPLPEPVPSLPVTVNGRIFPREDVDLWTFDVPEGGFVVLEAVAGRIGSPLQPVLEVSGPAGERIAVQQRFDGDDPTLWFTAKASGRHQVAIRDSRYGGHQAYVYRLTLKTGAHPVTVFPLGGRRGERIEFRVEGPGMEPETTTIELPGSGPAHRIETHGRSLPLHLDELPEILEGEAIELTVPGIANGRIDRPGESDRWFVDLAAKEAVAFEILAAAWGSRLDARLRVLDAEGKELAANSDGAPGTPDAKLQFTAAKAGRFQVEISDEFGTRGGPEFGYRLKATRPAAMDFRLTLGRPTLNVVPRLPPEDGKKPARTRGTGVEVVVEPVGAFNSDVELEFIGLPDGVTASETKVPFRTKKLELFFDAPPEAKPGVAAVTIRGKARIDDSTTLTRDAVILVPPGHPDAAELTVAVAPFVPFRFAGQYESINDVPAGSTMTKRFALHRSGYDGPVRVRLGDRQGRTLQGVTGPVVEVPAGATSFDYTIFYPARMELGRTARVQLLLEAGVPDPNGKARTLSYTSFEQEDQIITIAASGQLGLATPVSTLRLPSGTPVRLPVSLKRGKDLLGRPIRLDLVAPAHLRDAVSCDSVEIPGDESSSELILLRTADRVCNAPLLVRATTADPRPDRHVAEIAVEIMPDTFVPDAPLRLP